MKLLKYRYDVFKLAAAVYESMLAFCYRCRQHLLPSHLYDRCLDFVDDAGDGQWSVVSEYPVVSFLVEYLQYSEAL